MQQSVTLNEMSCVFVQFVEPLCVVGHWHEYCRLIVHDSLAPEVYAIVHRLQFG